MTDGRRAPHPANTLNELPGEEWLYFTKSLLTTAYPSELGHAARRAHGANKPPRLMARLIEFFSQTGELVLDPFAGVGGTLLGAAIARGPRRAIGIELEPRWAAVFDDVVRDLSAERDGAGPLLADLGTADPGGPRPFDPSGVELRVGDAAVVLPTIETGLGRLRRDRPAVQPAAADDDGRRRARRDPRQPPDRLRDGHRPAGRPRERRRLPGVPRPDGAWSSASCGGSCARVATPWSSSATRTRTGATCSPAPTSPRGRRPSGSCPRATSSGTRRGRGYGRTATRTRSCRTSSTSTSSCCATKPSVSSPRRRRDSR